MPKRHISPKDTQRHHRRSQNAQSNEQNFEQYMEIVKKYLQETYVKMNENYLVVCAVLFVIILGFLLPDISYKMHRTKELQAMKSTLDVMTKEVTNAEAACLSVADNLCYLQRSMLEDQAEITTNPQDVSSFKGNPYRDAEEGPVHKEIGFFRRIFLPRSDAPHKEITFMSYIYSDTPSFQDALNYTEEAITDKTVDL